MVGEPFIVVPFIHLHCMVAHKRTSQSNMVDTFRLFGSKDFHVSLGKYLQKNIPALMRKIIVIRK